MATIVLALVQFASSFTLIYQHIKHKKNKRDGAQKFPFVFFLK